MSFLCEIEKDFDKLCQCGAEKIEIGKTALGRNIYAFEIGCGSPKIIAQYAIHAREYITYYLANLHAISLLKSLGIGNGTIYIIPVVNIDGVALCIDGVDTTNEFADNLLELNNHNNFSLWKANARGVDLNVNFPARWGKGKQNTKKPGSQNYIGLYPASESETRALMDFTERVRPNLTLSFHSKGEVIYYDFHQQLKQKLRDRKIAQIASASTGYKIVPSGKSAGGYKDWCITKGIPALTIEIGQDDWSHPIGREKLPLIWHKNKNLIMDLLQYLKSYKIQSINF